MYQFSENQFLSLFDDKERARSSLTNISRDIPTEYLTFLSRLQFELGQIPVPEEVLIGFENLTRSVINKISFYKMLCDFPPIIARLAQIFTSSRFLSELITKDFQYTYFLIRPDQDCRPFDIQSLRKSLKAITENKTYSLNRKMEQLRILKRRELLKIGIRDYVLDDPLDITTGAISDLADEFIRTCYLMHFEELQLKNGTPDTPCAVIALGKLGGHELNYSSDIDLMFVYGEEGDLSYDGREISHHEFFNHLCQRMTASISLNTREGILYRIDTRLRPDGDAGPLARSVPSSMFYYETRGRLWERQMLIKARPVAGNIEFGNDFLKKLTPFVYPRTFFESPLREIAQMKWRIEEQKSTEKLNIKICPGGIRDIEFIVQVLQLINGGRMPDIRGEQTLAVLKKLFDHKFLTEKEYHVLKDAYIFYRKIEHILQIEHDRQVHSLSGNTGQIRKISYILKFDSVDNFLGRLNNSLLDVRAIYDSVFETAHLESGANDLSTVLASDNMDPIFIRQLTDSGFQSPANAFRILRLLNFGHFPKLYSHAIQDSFVRLFPSLFEELQNTPDPDHTIMNFENIVSKYPMIDMLYKTFIDRPDFLHMVIRLSSYSHTFVSILCEAPTYLEYLMTHYQEWLFETGYDPALEYSHYKSLTHFKRMEFIRLALQLSDQKYSQNILFKNLSRLADYTLNQVFEKHFKANDDLVVFGLGKLGGQELSFKSDLDVIFVCADTAEVDDLIAKAKKFLNEISAVSEQGRIYEIDARLRPEGTRAPLVVTASRYADYLETRAAFWERQALVKARCVCGDRSLAEQVQRLFSAKIYGKGLSNDDAGSIIQMRQRQIKEKIKTPSDVLLDTKFSRGALLDIEYLIQAYQIKFGEKYPPLQTTNTIDAIDVFKKTEIFSSADADCLIENYIFLRNLEVYNFLAFERKSNKLSADEKQLAFLSKFLKFNKSTSIVDHLSTIKKQNEEIFSKLMRDLSHGK